MLIADMAVWLATGAWSTETLGSVLIERGDEALLSPALLFLANIPIGFCLVLAAPGVFLAAITTADWLEGN